MGAFHSLLQSAMGGFSNEKQAYSNAKAQTLASSQGRATNKDVMAEYLKSDAGKADQMALSYNNLDVSEKNGYDQFLSQFNKDNGLGNIGFNSVAGRKL